ncbi:MAG: ABC transporter ATP-binding protein [Chloroflexota bacterium]
MTDGTPAVLEVDRLTVAFKHRHRAVIALSDVSLRIRQGELVGLVGESGCGKSLTSLAIMRLLPRNAVIEKGSITVAGTDVTGLDEAGMRRVRGHAVAMIFQEPMVALNPLVAVGKQVEEGMLLHLGISARERRDRGLELMRSVGIPDPLTRYRQLPFELSGGMRQRVMIAMAIACGPRLIIADEPTTALDVTIQAQILDLLKDVRERFGTAILFITHDLGVIADVADRVVVMYAGQVVESAPVDELFERPAHPYTEGLLHSIPAMVGQVAERLPSIPGRVPPLEEIPSACPFQDRCPYVSGICREQRPPLEPPRKDHFVACWHPRNVGTET